MKKIAAPVIISVLFILGILVFSTMFRPVVSPTPESSGVTLILLSPEPVK